MPYIGCQRGARRGAAGERDGAGESPGQRSAAPLGGSAAQGGRARGGGAPRRGGAACCSEAPVPFGQKWSRGEKKIKKRRKEEKKNHPKTRRSQPAEQDAERRPVPARELYVSQRPVPRCGAQRCAGPRVASARGCRGRLRARSRPPALAGLLCGRGARAGPLASGGAIGCRPSCASLDTLAAPRGTARCANTGSGFPALKGAAPAARRPLTAARAAAPPRPAPPPRSRHSRGKGSAGGRRCRGRPGESRSWRRGGGARVKAPCRSPPPPLPRPPPAGAAAAGHTPAVYQLVRRGKSSGSALAHWSASARRAAPPPLIG